MMGVLVLTVTCNRSAQTVQVTYPTIQQHRVTSEGGITRYTP